MLLEILFNWIEANKGSFFDSRYRQTEPLAFNHFWTHYKEKLSLINEGRPKGEKIKEATKEYLRNEYDRILSSALPQKALDDKRRELAYTDPTTVVDTILLAATGEVTDLNRAILQHWLWQIKRKLFGLPVVNHLFVMLYEPVGGSGKTTLINRMVEPLADYVLNWNLGMMSDERNLPALTAHFIVIFDEMSKPDKVHVDVLKHQITATFNDIRVMREHSTMHLRQNCTFIGASNKPLDTLIVDSSSMRRFFQINCLPKMDWDAVNGFDALGLWRGIDETLTDGYLTSDLLERCREKQSDLQTVDIVDQFVDEFRLKPVEGQPTHSVSSTDLFVYYQSYAVRNGITNPGTAAAFCKKNGLSKNRTMKQRLTVVNADHLLFSELHKPTIWKTEAQRVDEITGGQL